MGHRSRTTGDPKWEENCLQNCQFRTLVVPGLSFASWSSPSSTSRMQDMTPSASQDPDKARSDSPASGNWTGTGSHRMYRNDRLQLPEWCTSSHNIWRTQKFLCTHLFSGLRFGMSHERGGKIKLRKHNISAQFAKCRDCDVCLTTKLTRAPCRRRIGEALPRSEKFGDMVTALPCPRFGM